MSNIAVFNPAGNVPAFARQGGAITIGRSLAGGGGGGKRVSIKGGVFRLMVDGKEVTAIDDRYLDVVLVNAAPKISRTFYLKPFDETNPAPPDCWSADGTTPDATSKNKQAASCATCPQNAKGSGQGDSRACRYSQRVALVLANDMEGDVLQLQLPATSIFGKAEGNDNRPLQDYARWLQAQNPPIDPSMVVTRMKFDTAAATPKLFFKAMRWLTQEEFELCQQQGQSPDAIAAITMSVAQTDGLPGASTPAAAAPAPALAAPPQDEEPPPPPPKSRARKVPEATAPAGDDIAHEPDPQVRTAKAPAQGPSASLAQTLAQWDDE